MTFHQTYSEKPGHNFTLNADFASADPAAYDAASDEVMGVLRDLGHPVEVWGWDEAYVGAGLADPAALADASVELLGNVDAWRAARAAGSPRAPASPPPAHG